MCRWMCWRVLCWEPCLPGAPGGLIANCGRCAERLEACTDRFQRMAGRYRARLCLVPNFAESDDSCLIGRLSVAPRRTHLNMTTITLTKLTPTQSAFIRTVGF